MSEGLARGAPVSALLDMKEHAPEQVEEEDHAAEDFDPVENLEFFRVVLRAPGPDDKGRATQCG